MFSMVPSYESVLTFFWVQAPHEGLRQALVVAVVLEPHDAGADGGMSVDHRFDFA